ncbi:pickpocket protein 28 [Stomoxys calcitrans]|uniref:pickpocket protein 28 n=1 Tax=Stomoxys calcitrans TaxID=35570 RepID=UPI0027E24B98|nr:pickpocket protein 28 [Stomoxys calcitrans]
MGNIKKYLQETTLHGFKYLADSSLSNWEKLFFFAALLSCSVVVIHLISNIYARWDSTPVLIGISPHPIPIVNLPMPAITLCNMNQALYSRVANYSKDSKEYAILRYLCFSDSMTVTDFENSEEFKNNDIQISDFITQHAHPCSRMLLQCQIGSIVYNCSELFREVLTDEGLCCSFNTLEPEFLFKGNYHIIKALPRNSEFQPVTWSPETGYQSNLPPKYYPHRTLGTGISMGITIFLNAEVDEYYCSSTSGPGFKLSLSSPIDMPQVKEVGVTVPLRSETRFRMDVIRSESATAIRSIKRQQRQCVFLNEIPLLYYKYYSKRHCENECQSAYLIRQCGCIPYHLPPIYSNATFCTMKSSFCVERAQQRFSRALTGNCLSRCMPSCFDLTFMPDAFSSSLTSRNYSIQSPLLASMSREELSNIAVLHFYFRESVIHSELKNVYIGLTEFLSNTGGILGLFMGFSFISVAEIVYFSVLRPVFKFVVPKKYRKSAHIRRVSENKNWLPDEITKATRKSIQP